MFLFSRVKREKTLVKGKRVLTFRKPYNEIVPFQLIFNPRKVFFTMGIFVVLAAVETFELTAVRVRMISCDDCKLKVSPSNYPEMSFFLEEMTMFTCSQRGPYLAYTRQKRLAIGHICILGWMQLATEACASIESDDISKLDILVKLFSRN